MVAAAPIWNWMQLNAIIKNESHEGIRIWFECLQWIAMSNRKETVRTSLLDDDSLVVAIVVLAKIVMAKEFMAWKKVGKNVSIDYRKRHIRVMTTIDFFIHDVRRFLSLHKEKRNRTIE